MELSLSALTTLSSRTSLRRAAILPYMDGDAFVHGQRGLPRLHPGCRRPGDDADFVVEGVDGYFVQIIDDTAVGLQIPQTVTLK
ncbi:MAG: hypothetical protein R3F22_04065 [Lysobacteraceae bacterium]